MYRLLEEFVIVRPVGNFLNIFILLREEGGGGGVGGSEPTKRVAIFLFFFEKTWISSSIEQISTGAWLIFHTTKFNARFADFYF